MTGSIGVLGGTFDPIHHGHLRIALEILELLGLDQLRLIPLHTPSHRNIPIAKPEQRLAMLKLATEGIPELIADDCEIRRQGTSYMIDTLQTITREHKGHTIYLIMGMDAFQTIDTWQQWHELLNYAHIALVDRPGNNPEFDRPQIADFYSKYKVTQQTELNKSSGNIIRLTTPKLDISSSQIRQFISEGKNIRYLLPDKVITYIKTHSLYL